MVAKMQTYFIHAPILRRVKIGRSADAIKGFRSVQGSSPEVLTLLTIIEGDHEAELHKRFIAYHSHLEWFSECEEIMEYARTNGISPGPLAPQWIPHAIRPSWLSHWRGSVMPDIESSKLLTVASAANALGVTEDAARWAIYTGRMNVLRIGSSVRVKPREIERLIRAAILETDSAIN